MSSLLNLEVRSCYSPFYLKIIALMHAFAIYLLCISAYPPLFVGAAIALLIGHLLFALCKIMQTVTPLFYITADGWEMVKDGNTSCCKPGSVLFESNTFIVFFLHTSKRKMPWMICADQVSTNVYHRLRVILNSKCYS